LLDEALLLHEAGEPLLQVPERVVKRLVMVPTFPDGPTLVQGPCERPVEAVDAEFDPAGARGPTGDRRVGTRQGRSGLSVTPTHGTDSSFLASHLGGSLRCWQWAKVDDLSHSPTRRLHYDHGASGRTPPRPRRQDWGSASN